MPSMPWLCRESTSQAAFPQSRCRLSTLQPLFQQEVMQNYLSILACTASVQCLNCRSLEISHTTADTPLSRDQCTRKKGRLCFCGLANSKGCPDAQLVAALFSDVSVPVMHAWVALHVCLSMCCCLSPVKSCQCATCLSNVAFV